MREKGDTPSKRGSSLRNYLDQTTVMWTICNFRYILYRHVCHRIRNTNTDTY